MKVMKRALAVLLLAACAGAQPPARRQGGEQPPGPAAWPIEAIAVEGNKLYTKEAIIAVSGLRPGLPGAVQLLEMAKDRLLNSGYFEQVSYRYEPAPGSNSYFASLVVVEIQQRYRWRIEELPVTEAEFRAIGPRFNPLFGDLIPASQEALDRYGWLLGEMAKQKGANVQVAGAITPLGKDELIVLFRPKAPAAAVADVQFTGTEAVNPHILRQMIAPVAIGTPYSELRFREFLENQLRPVFDSVGRLRAKFDKLSTAPAQGLRGIVVTVAVEEGPEYKLANIEVSGSGLSQSAIRAEGQFKVGERVNYSDVGKGMERILAQVKEGGYMKPSYRAQRKVNDSDNTVELLIEVLPGDRYEFGKLTIVGLELEGEHAVRKLWALKPGQPFRASYPDYFLERIRSDQVFDNLGKTKSEVKLDEAARVADVTLTFAGNEPKSGSGQRRRP
jgi:outer membrane protein assembly factor BamA